MAAGSTRFSVWLNKWVKRGGRGDSWLLTRLFTLTTINFFFFVVYKSPAYEALAFRLLVDKLCEQGYPSVSIANIFSRDMFDTVKIGRVNCGMSTICHEPEPLVYYAEQAEYFVRSHWVIITYIPAFGNATHRWYTRMFSINWCRWWCSKYLKMI